VEFNSVSLHPNPAENAAIILVVEDELLVRMTISDCLRDAGFNVIEAFNADEAIQILHSDVSIDLVLSDVRMPGSMDGMELMHYAQEKLPGVPFIITSGHLMAQDALAQGAKEFLRKPYSFDRALVVVESALGKGR
jgi:DNA-binding NtrC family response regulator